MSGEPISRSAELSRRHRIGKAFEIACLVSTWSGLAVLIALLAAISYQAWGWIDWQFISSFDSRNPEQAGILAAMWGTLWLMVLTAMFAVPIGVGAAVYLEEYASDNLLTRIIRVNLSNLAGVPSIVYGILGLTAFVRMFGAFGAESKVLEVSLGFGTLAVPLPFGRSVIAGALTLSLLVLPVVIISTQEALRAVPPSLRHASYALGATKWQTIRYQVLPAAIPGTATGVILALSRAMGETAPLLMIGALTYVAYTPGNIASLSDIWHNPDGFLNAPFDSFTAIPLLIYNWVGNPQAAYQHVAAAGIIVLLAILLLVNGIAIFVRQRFRKNIQW